MVNSNANALGILFPNSYDSLVPDLVGERLMASIPFAGRYRMVDFMLSSMVNCGIDNVSLIVRKNYHSLMDHLGSGREWDLTRKNGGLNIVPPFADKSVKVYNGRVEALSNILDFLRSQKEQYVVMSDTNIAANFDFKAMINEHITSGADVTIAYSKEEIPASARQTISTNRGLYYTLKVHGFLFEGYIARISDMKNYFDENMKLLDDANVDALFSPSPIYTKIRDDNPTRYIQGAVAKNIMAADGCVIEGEVENCVLFRGVKIAKGAKVKNCVLMQDTVVGEGASVEYLITDKNVTISPGKEVKGTDTFPVYVAKNQTV